MAKVHFIPRFILKRFKDSAPLLEFDKKTGTAVPRSVENAGQREDYWPEGIETGLMRRLDDAASKILERKVYDKSSIAL